MISNLSQKRETIEERESLIEPGFRCEEYVSLSGGGERKKTIEEKTEE